MADREPVVSGERFTEVLETRIEAAEGPFAEPHPFLPAALRGLAERLNSEIIPMGFVMATELYVYDVQTGQNGFTGEPMPAAVTGMPPVMTSIIRMVAEDVALEAYGEDFVSEVSSIRKRTADAAAEATDQAQ